MGIYLVRHGQASFMQDNYDLLSDLGRLQARALGTYWQKQGFKADCCLVGTLSRQTETAALIADEFHKAGSAFPDSVSHDFFNEHQAAELYHHLLPKLLEEPQNASLKADLDAKGHQDPKVKRQLLKIFFECTKRWAQGEIAPSGFEPYRQFRERVAQGYEMLQELSEQHGSIVLVSSGGVIGALLSHVLDLSDEKMVEVNWQVRNASLSELSGRKGKFYLRSFNEMPHLPQKEQWSYV